MKRKYDAPVALASDLTRILATELGRRDIRIDTVAPCAVDTPLARAADTEGVRQQSPKRSPLGFSSADMADR